MKIMKAVSILLAVIVTASCVSRSAYEEGYYTDQEKLECRHNPFADGVRVKGKKFGVFLLREEFPFSSGPEINTRIVSAVTNLNTYGMVIDDVFAMRAKAAKKNLAAQLQKIAAAYVETGQIAELDLQKAGSRLGYDYIVAVDIARISIADSPVLVNFMNSGFQVMEMHRKGSTDLLIRIIDVKGIKGVIPGAAGEAYLSLNEPVMQQYSSGYYYDTPETYRNKIAMVRMENARRQAVNKAEQERLAREYDEAEETKSSVDDIFAILDDVLTDELPMLPLSFPITKPKYALEKDFYEEIYTGAVNAVFQSYFARIDGMTIEGNTISGVGSFRFKNGDIYHGDWSDAAASGKGRYIYSDGRTYTGDFSEGCADGNGLYDDLKGNVYEGTYSEGVKHGSGIYKRGEKAYTAECYYGDYRGLSNPVDPEEAELRLRENGEIMNITRIKKRMNE